MRVVSNFYDYYDGLCSYDKDDISYYRVKKEVSTSTGEDTSKMQKYYRYRYRQWINNYNLDDYEWFTVLFCGHIYKGIKYDKKFYYNPDKFVAVYESKASKKIIEAFNQEQYFDDYNKDRRLMTEKELVYNKLTHQRLVPKFDATKYNSPVCFYPNYERIDDAKRYHDVIILDACLKEIEFFRCVDVRSTYQEIERWLGNQAPEHKPIPAISDKVMAEIKGFDKYSFRKDKSK
jgi:hypothetical protein